MEEVDGLHFPGPPVWTFELYRGFNLGQVWVLPFLVRLDLVHHVLRAAKVNSMPSRSWSATSRCLSQRKNPLALRVWTIPGWNNALPGSFLKPSQMSCMSCSVRMRKSAKSYNPLLCQAICSFLAVKLHSQRQYSVAYSLSHGGLGCIAKFAWWLTMMLASQVFLFAPVLSSCLAMLPVAIKQVKRWSLGWSVHKARC